MPPRRKRDPVLQRFQVENKGLRFFVIDTKSGATVAGPFKSRIRAQDRADQMERTTGG